MINFLSTQTLALAEKAEGKVKCYFEKIDNISYENTAKVLSAFREYRVAENNFYESTGYGYDDKGRDTLEQIYARVFGCEDALVRIQFVNGTHAIGTALYGCLEKGQKLVCATGLPYDTLHDVIGINSCLPGSLASYGIICQVVPMKDGKPDVKSIVEACSDASCALIQRSKGYGDRITLSSEMIGELIQEIRKLNRSIVVVVDNCYGEFTQLTEPTQHGADLIVGSLIKNPGGGIAQTGAYIAGSHELVKKCSYRLTVPGIGRECGATLGQNRMLYQGFFLAPHVTAQALKTAVFCASIMEELGYVVNPKPLEERYDIIQTIAFEKPDPLLRFCRGIQSGAPVNSFVTPEPWDMPGYNCQVVMAAGAFIQGSSIELSADAPMREPYLAYMQGGLTYESGKLGILLAINELLGI
ncbi:MAG: hypothetical protein GX633_02500 [Clostridiales bacterium]|nr:hypothetical protein [Clostridiales bacterium]